MRSYTKRLVDICADRGLFAVLAKTQGAVLPPALLKKDEVVLNFSRNFRPGDLVVDDQGIRQTLSFGGEAFVVFVPHANILHINGQGPSPDEKKPRNHLRLVKEDDS